MSLEWGQMWFPRDAFVDLTAKCHVILVVRRVLAGELSAMGVYRQLAHGNCGSFTLGSAEHGGSWEHQSFVGVSSAGATVAHDGRAQWIGSRPESALEEGAFLEVVHSALEELVAPVIEGPPPLTGVLVGSLGWGIILEWEPTLAATTPKESNIPDTTLVLVTEVAALDHATGSVHFMAITRNLNGSADGVDGAYDRAIERLDVITTQPAVPITPAIFGASGATPPEVRERTARAGFESSVSAAKRAIKDGDAFQIVVSQCLDVSTSASGIDVYRVLRTVNPSPYIYFLDLPDERGDHFAIAGSFPETLMKTERRRIWAYPVAGSRPCGTDFVEDHRLAAEPPEDLKELLEHVMLVDLACSNLSKVCDSASVEVSTFVELKRSSHIQYIPSTVTGVLRADADAPDALAATFPAGTLSGAPKPRAIQLIDDFEPATRGAHGGVVGYFGLSGGADLAIAIRTASLRDGTTSVQAGAGLAADSVPALEYVESRNKTAAAVESAVQASTLIPSS